MQIIGELVIGKTETQMLHGDTVFGTVRQTAYAGWSERWLINIPSLHFAAEEKSRAIAEDMLVAAYVKS